MPYVVVTLSCGAATPSVGDIIKFPSTTEPADDVPRKVSVKKLYYLAMDLVRPLLLCDMTTMGS